MGEDFKEFRFLKGCLCSIVGETLTFQIISNLVFIKMRNPFWDCFFFWEMIENIDSLCTYVLGLCARTMC